jgi:hypothetical protein
MKRALFWPTVGAILSGGRPGVSLYIVLIFSRSVCEAKRNKENDSSGVVERNGAYCLACAIEADNDDREFVLPMGCIGFSVSTEGRAKKKPG